MRLKSLFVIFIISLLVKGQTSSSVRLSNISPIDVVNDGIVCPNVYPVEFTCIGVEVGILQWDRNDQRIDVFTSLSEKGSVLQDGPLTLFLDSIIRSGSGYNMTSRLVTNISNLNTGDRILCRTMNAMDAIELNYMLRESPPVLPTNFSVFVESNGATVDISITWPLAFSLLHDVTSYRVVASGGSAASCPSSCDPSGPCMCTGLGIGEDTNIIITAINCGDQMGTPVQVIARPQVPLRPSKCSVLPVYSSTGNLIAVDLTWTSVNNPPEFLPGVSQEVTDYSIAVGTLDPITTPASTACPISTCNYSVQSLNVFNSPLSASVSAVNVIGRGEECIPQTEIDTTNQIFSLTLDTTNIGNQTIACILISAEECEFCYSAGDSCQNLTCIPATETPTLLPSLTEPTYCYRATASVSGNAVAVIQDTFNTACPLAALGTTTEGISNHRCSSDSMGSVSIPHGLGCYDGQRRGALTNYQCDKWYALSGGSSRICMGDGNWDGEVPECRPNGGNIAMLVVSILLWIFSLFLTVFAAVAFKKEIFVKDKSLFNFHILPLPSKIMYVVLFMIECLFLLVVLSLWISAGAIPNSGSVQTSLLIAALVLALPWIASALIFLFVMSKCSCCTESGDSQKNEESGKSKQSDVTIKTPSPPVYATPDISKKKNRRPETKEHKPDPDQPIVGKSKGFLVKKGKGKNKASENIELPSYDVLEGPGHHTGKPPAKAPVTQEKYDVLDVKGQQVDNHTPVNQPRVCSTIPGEADEYSQVDKNFKPG